MRSTSSPRCVRIQIFALAGRRHPTSVPSSPFCYSPCEESDARPQYHSLCQVRRSSRSRTRKRRGPIGRSFRPRLLAVSSSALQYSNPQHKVGRHLDFDREVPTQNRFQRILLSSHNPSLLAGLGLFSLSRLVQFFEWTWCGRED